MSAAEKLKLTFKMIDENVPYLFLGSKELISKRFELLRRENDERNKNTLECLQRAQEKNHP